MSTTSSTRIAAGALAAGVLGAVALSTGAAAPAHAAPVGVTQLPAHGILSQGLGNWSLYGASIRIETAGYGEVWFSAPGGDACNRGAAGTLVRFDFTTPGAMRTGSGTVRPCPGPFSGPLRTKLYTGPGTVIGSVSIISTGGPWQLPGVATFTVPG